MATLVERPRSDGKMTFVVRWREGGGRNGTVQTERFTSAPTDKGNRNAATVFKAQVEQAGEHWPEGWVKGRGFVQPDEPAAPAPRTMLEVGLEYVAQITGITPGQRRRYNSQLRILATIELHAATGESITPFAGPIDEVNEMHIRLWLNQWSRSLKTKSNYHGLMSGVFSYAVEQGLITKHPASRTAPRRAQVRASRKEKVFLKEAQFAALHGLADADDRDLLQVDAGTGLRFGEITALWVEDVDFEHGMVRINKAWKREGENGERDVPGWLLRRLKPKHEMRGHYLGHPKTPKSRRTIKVSPTVLATLGRLCVGKALDDFVFVTATGRPIHHADWYEGTWRPLMLRAEAVGLPRLGFHDLRHSHVAWLIAGKVPLPHIQGRLGHESIQTTIDEYGHLLPQGEDLIVDVIEDALAGKRVGGLRLVQGAVS